MRRRGIARPARPSLFGTAATTAVVVGTASAVSGKVSSNQAAKAQQSAVAAPNAQPAPAGAVPVATPQPGLTDEAYEQLKKLGELREAGILTDEEFQAKKAQILAI